MGLKEGLLCLLAVGDNHGYGLKGELEATTADTWQVNVGQVYTTLQRLERDGLVVHSTVGGGRIVYSLTNEGHNAAMEWIGESVDLAVAGRDELSLKILMAMRSGIEDPRRVIERQRGSTMMLLQDYTRLKTEDPGGDFGWQLYLDRLIFSAEAELRWLERVEGRLEEMPSSASVDRVARPDQDRQEARR